MTQVNIIRKQLLEGNTLTQRSALLDFGIMALPRRIADLRESGFPVKVEMKTNPNTGQRYASYSMEEYVKHICELKPDCVYRLTHIQGNLPFAGVAVANSQGYFRPMRRPRISDDEVMITMAGIPQVLLQNNLDVGVLSIRYIGGMA